MSTTTTATTVDSALRWAPRSTEEELDVTGIGTVPLRLGGRDRTRPFLLLHGGAGPASVSGFGDLMAAREYARILVPSHPGFDGTPRPAALTSAADLAALYVTLLDRLDLWDVTVIGNSLGGWVAAEVALRGSPRVSGAVLIDAVGPDVPGHPITDIRTLSPQELVALSFHDPARAPGGSTEGPTPDAVAANMAALFTYGGETMTDPTLLPRLADLDLPVHVIWGASDGIAPPAIGRALADAIGGARFTLLPDAGHLPQLEQPEELLGAIMDLGRAAS